ncbi:hypothetical protein GcM3_066029, partial [Golovinomyces cichoracearum]
GKRLKTCSKHTNKRPLPQIDDWDSYIYEINNWSQPGQNRKINLSYTFDLDQLPVSFGHSLEADSDSQLNKAIGLLVHLTREAGGHRFRKLTSAQNDNWFYYYYSCCQDSEHVVKSMSSGKRDRGRMQRFRCQSSLKLQVNLSNRLLKIKLEHDYHPPYLDIRLSHDA